MILMAFLSAVFLGVGLFLVVYKDDLQEKYGNWNRFIFQTIGWAAITHAVLLYTEFWDDALRRIITESSLWAWLALIVGAFYTFPGSLLIAGVGRGIWAFFSIWTGGSKKKSQDGQKEVIRGVAIASAEDVTSNIKKNHETRGVQIGGVPVPFGLENRSFLLAGSPGTGKSVAIHPIVEAILARGDRAIIVDRGGLYLKRHFRPGDVVLNPFDSRDAGWSPFAEIRTEKDIALVAKSFIPDGEGNEKTWTDYAQVFAKAAILRLIQNRKTTNADLFHVLALQKQEEVEAFLQGTAAARLVSGDAKGLAASVFGSAVGLSENIEKLDPDAGRDAFSIKRWVREGSGSMYLTYDGNSVDFLRGLIAAQVDIAAREITSLDEDLNRRIWLVIDETSSIGKVGGLPNFLSNARKNGGCAILGFQTIAQARATYGHHVTQEILTGATNVLTLRVTDAETAEMMSKAIGDREVKLTTVSHTASENSSTTTSHQYRQERAILPSELQNLPDLVGYLNLAGDIPPCKVKLPIPKAKSDVAEPFIEKANADLYESPARPAPVQTTTAAVPAVAQEVVGNPFPVIEDTPFPVVNE